eukprot:g6280.t1
MNDGLPGASHEGGGMDSQINVQRLEHLSAHEDRFQVEAFYRGLQRHGNRRNMFPFFRGNNGGGGGGAPLPNEANVDNMLLYSPDPIPTSLLKLSNDYATRSMKMFLSILKYMGIGADYITDHQKVEIAQKLLHQGLKRLELRDELYMLLIKQTRGNPSLDSKLKAWELFHLIASTMPPAKEFVGLVLEQIHWASHGDTEEQIVKEIASKTWVSLKRSLQAGPRRSLPSAEEIGCLATGQKLTCIVFFLDETFEELTYEMTTTVSEAMKQLAEIIRLQNYQTFTLFECQKLTGARRTEDTCDEHIMLDDNKYIADVLWDFKNSRNSREGIQSKLLVKKKLFRETDETISESQFINLSFVQAQYDYLLGNYPVVKEDAAQLCALQALAEHGSVIFSKEDELMHTLQRYVPKQAYGAYSPEEWVQAVISRSRVHGQPSKEEARLQFLRILRSLPYGHSIFFPVNKMEDPIGLLPNKLILGINKRGIHFFAPTPREYLHSAELRDIMQFGSSNQAVFFKMRVTGVLHIFQFETKQGEDICLALQTHINDIMMKRYSKSKAAANQSSAAGYSETNQAAADSAQRGGDSPQQQQQGPADAQAGPKHEKHANQLQKVLEGKTRMIEELQKREEELRAEQKRVAEELCEEMEKLKAEEESKNELIENKKKLEEEQESLRRQIEEAKKSLGEAEASKAAAVDAAREAVDAKMVKEMESRIHEATEELQQVQERIRDLESQSKSIEKEKGLLEKKMNRLEASRETETRELRDKLEAAKDSVGQQLKDKDSKISELMEELSKTTELFNANKLELEQIKTDLNELDDLREMKQDVERKEKLQKKIISDQANRLEELEKLHKEEQMLRKKYLSMMEDMLGKVRVSARLAPAGDDSSKQIVEPIDEYTLAKIMEDRFAVREEFAFDQAYGPTLTNKEVFETVQTVSTRCIEGFNVCVSAYGLSGSGKTHTMFGPSNNDGMISLSVAEVFNMCKKRSKKWESSLEACMFELHNEELTDLFATSKKKLVVKKDIKGLVHVVNAHFVSLTSVELLNESIGKGLKKLNGLEHDKNASHVFVMVNVECSNKDSGVINNGRMVFTDLAGCNGGDSSLKALTNVVHALEKEEMSIPYTSCTLTKLMSDCLGGNSKTLIIVHVHPQESLWDETKKALELGLSIRKVKNEIEKSEINKEIMKTKKQLEALKVKAGIPKELLDAVDMVDIIDEKPQPSDTASVQGG